jgi:hypothetical protein
MSTSTNSNQNIPLASKLVCPGDPAMKAHASKRYSVPSHLEELNARIDELESAIGQDANGPVGRAFAIRAEKSCDKDSDASVGHLYPKKSEKNQEPV